MLETIRPIMIKTRQYIAASQAALHRHRILTDVAPSNQLYCREDKCLDPKGDPEPFLAVPAVARSLTSNQAFSGKQTNQE